MKLLENKAEISKIFSVAISSMKLSDYYDFYQKVYFIWRLKRASDPHYDSLLYRFPDLHLFKNAMVL